MIDDEQSPARSQKFRLAWKFCGSGTTGSGPWMHNRETVEAWLESLNRRYNGRIEHWVETAPLEPWRQ